MSTTYELASPNGRPLIRGSDGVVLPLCAASDPVLDKAAMAHSAPEQWLQRMRYFAESGIHVWSLQPSRLPGLGRTTPFWTGDGEYPDPPRPKGCCIQWQAEKLLEIDPEARFFVRFGDEWPAAWLEANPEHVQQNATGETRKWGSKQASLASQKALSDLNRFMARMITWCEQQPWSDRVFGYMYLPHGEGISNLVVSGMVFDVSPVMQEAFRGFVRKRYPEVSALREAWNDPRITFESVRVPRDAEWRAVLSGGSRGVDEPPGGEWYLARKPSGETVRHWVQGLQLRRFRDFFELQRELSVGWYRSIIRATVALRSARPSLFGIDMAKQHLLGWQHNLFFNNEGPGPESLEMFNASGSIGFGELLDEPGLDMLLTPADYTARHVGYGWEPEGIADALRIRGKAILIENDSRTFCTTGNEHRTAGAFRNIREVRAGFLRNCAWILTRGGYDEWGTGGGGYYDHPEVQAHGIRPCVKLMESARDWPHRETEHALAMIVDDFSPWEENGTSGYQNLACIWQRCLGLAHCGIPYRIHLFSDLGRDSLPDYRAYYFPNLFRIDAPRLEVLKRKVFRDGRLSLFGPATGITDGRVLSAAGASRVLGVTMDLTDAAPMRRVIVRGDHPIVGALPACMTYGDSHPYGPVILPVDGALAEAGAVELGVATLTWSLNRSGLFVKDHGTHKVAWTAAVPMPAALLRELARWGGCHVWCDDDAVVLASDSVVALHSGKPGRHVIRLPAKRRVHDALQGREMGATDRIELDLAPPETRIFRMENI